MIVVNVLGDPVLRRDGTPVTGRAAYRRRLALLAILAAARGRPVGRERLIGLLWPEHPADAARHTLSESLYILRKELGEQTFRSLGDEVALNPDVVGSDLDAFERALAEGRTEEAVAAYGGPFLDGFYVADAPDFERWAEGERDRLARALARALEELADADEAAGRPLRAADWWRQLAVRDPFSSRVVLRLAQALRAAGEHTAALRHAEAHAALLREELGVGPDPELAAFVERLRAETRPLPPPPVPAPAVPSALHHGAPEIAASPGETGNPVGSTAEEADASSSSPSTDAVPAAADADGPVSVPGAGYLAGAHVASTPVLAPHALVAPSGPPVPPPPSYSDAAPVSADVPIPNAPIIPGTTAVPDAGDGPLPPRRMRWRMPAALGAGVLAVLALLLLAAPRLGIGGYGRGAESDAEAEGRMDPRRIAVLYFDDYSRGGELAYLANGLTEMLIHELSQVEALDVVSRNGVKPYRLGNVPFDSMRADLRVGSVVEGSVQRAGDSVRVTVQLIDANTHSHLASRVIVRPLDDVFAVENALAQEVSGILRRRLGRQIRLREAGAGTRSTAALALVLQAAQAREDAAALAGSRDSLDARSAVRLLRHSDSLLARAEAEDPRWTRPTLLRGWSALALADRTPPAGQPALHQAAGRFAERVLAREPRSPEALELRGRMRWRAGLLLGAEGARQLDEAERDLRAAVAGRPTLASAWGTLSQLLLSRGRFAEADQAARRALSQDAYLDEAADIHQQLFFGALMTGDYAAARDVCGRAHRAFPADARFVECGLTVLREDAAAAPDTALAWRLVAELDRLDPPARARATGHAYAPIYRRVVAAAISARAGDAARARAELARARAEAAGDAESRVALAYDEAYVLLMLGDREGARARLDAYLAARPAVRPFLARDPLFRTLVSEGPRAP